MYGQYSAGAAGRLTKAEMTPRGAVSSRKAGHNRIIWTDADGATHFRLIETDVVTRRGNRVELADGGWPTMTTRRAMMEGLAALAPELVDTKGQWGAANIWGAKIRAKRYGGDSALLLMRYTPQEAPPERPWETSRYERQAVPFCRRIVLELGPEGAVIVERDSDAPPHD